MYSNIIYIYYSFEIAIGLTEDQPQEEYRNNPVDVDLENPHQEEQPSNELREEVSLLEETILVRVMGKCHNKHNEVYIRGLILFE